MTTEKTLIQVMDSSAAQLDWAGQVVNDVINTAMVRLGLGSKGDRIYRILRDVRKGALESLDVRSLANYSDAYGVVTGNNR